MVVAVDDVRFWHHHCEELALLTTTRTGRLSDVVTGEAPIERTNPAQSMSASVGNDNVKRRRVQRPRMEQSSKVMARAHTHNRRGVPLCTDFQTGACAVSTRGTTCPRNGNASPYAS